MNHYAPITFPSLLLLLTFLSFQTMAQQDSVRPGINSYYMDPEWQHWVNQFERPGREVYDYRYEILNASTITPGMAVADIGAGTGLFTRLISPLVGNNGKVYAVDISRTFVENILLSSKQQGLNNVTGIVNSDRDVQLPAKSIDLAFTVDTYHHFEYPQSTLESIHQALKPQGRLIIIDFRKTPGFSSGWVMGHVRANQDKVIKEVTANGFELIDEKDVLKTNYFLEFRKTER